MPLDTGLRNKVITISGGCGDIGGATAKVLAEQGAKVVLLDVLGDADGRKRAAELGAAEYRRCDQTDRSAVDAATLAINQSFGRLDVMIANAAAVVLAPFHEIQVDDWRMQLDVNVTGCFHLAQSAVRWMMKQQPDAGGVRGKVLFTSSWVARFPLANAAPYITTKGAVDAMMRAMAHELAGYGIRVNCVAPGILYAGLTRKLCEKEPGRREKMEALVPLGSLGTPEQVADTYAFLCSRQADYFTGQTVTVDGGCSVIKR